MSVFQGPRQDFGAICERFWSSKLIKKSIKERIGFSSGICFFFSFQKIRIVFWHMTLLIFFRLKLLHTASGSSAKSLTSLFFVACETVDLLQSRLRVTHSWTASRTLQKNWKSSNCHGCVHSSLLFTFAIAIVVAELLGCRHYIYTYSLFLIVENQNEQSGLLQNVESQRKTQDIMRKFVRNMQHDMGTVGLHSCVQVYRILVVNAVTWGIILAGVFEFSAIFYLLQFLAWIRFCCC